MNGDRAMTLRVDAAVTEMQLRLRLRLQLMLKIVFIAMHCRLQIIRPLGNDTLVNNEIRLGGLLRLVMLLLLLFYPKAASNVGKESHGSWSTLMVNWFVQSRSN